jgi:uncharacterized protein (DUF305 family)
MQQKYARSRLLPALVLVAILALVASCANSGGGEEQGSNGSGDGMQGMAHGSESTDDASEMLMENGEYSDERFIDAMVPHHQGAIEMAQVALENAEHPEIQALAEEIVAAQESEIGQLKAIKQEQFGTSEVSMDMSAEEMEGMGMTSDPQELTNQEPFDKAFIDNMIPHHESAIAMAQVVLEESENPEIREIAGAIVDAQEREIEQMTSWRDEWYPEG